MSRDSGIAISVLVVVGLYVGSYFALVIPRTESVYVHRIGTWIGTYAEYRTGGEFARTIFAPIQRWDRELRPEYWRPRNPDGP